MKKPKFKLKKKAKLILLASFIIIILGISIYLIIPVSFKYKEVNITIESGMGTREIAHVLKEKKLIKSKNIFILYSKIKNVSYYAASYHLSPDMSINKIINELQTTGYSENEVALTIREGMNIRDISKLISKNTDNSYNDVIKALKDKDYLNSIIDKYWFVSNDIKDSSLYYSLEGYLFPETYYFDAKNSSVYDIFNTMLDQMDKVLSDYKDEIKNSDYSMHELLTLASVTQSEGYNESDFKNIASVFYNRMKSGIALGSCVTSYYGVKKDMTDELYASDINDNNSYNTRGENPVLFPSGPISAPGKDAIDAVLKPKTTDYYYFVSDKNHKLYFTKTLTEHEQMISKLEQEGLWLEW